MSEALVDPQFVARAFFVEVDDPQLGAVRLPGAPFRGSALRWQAASAASDAARTQASTASTTPQRSQKSVTRAPPLDDLRVLDLTHDWAAPHCARLPADSGT